MFLNENDRFEHKTEEDKHALHNNNVVWLMQLLRAADEFCIDAIKSITEERLTMLVDRENVEEIHREADKLQALSLTKYCEWIMRQSSPLILNAFSQSP